MVLQGLEKWFLSTKRSFPWRKNITPYAVLVSEVMLQQTQADRVISYFNRWMARFPTIHDVSCASVEEVMKYWEGLGYYSRARSLLKAARYIVDEFNGVIPDSEEALLKIPGIGPYTAGAILSFAFQKRAAAIDANVLRVLSRLFTYPQDVNSATSRVELQKKLLEILPQKNAHVSMEALIELGALICTKKPICAICPLQDSCQAFHQDIVDEFPKKKMAPARINLYRCVLVVECRAKFLVVQRPLGGIMGGLYEFPYVELEEEISKDDLHALVAAKIRTGAQIQPLLKVQHGFTKYSAKLFPFYVQSVDEPVHLEGEWKTRGELDDLAFSSGHKKIKNQI